MEKISQIVFQKKIKSKKDFIEILYKEYGTKLYAYAVHSWKLNEDTAWDLTYKTLYRIVEVLPKYNFEEKEKFQSFLFTTFINYIKNYFRDNKIERSQIHVEVDENLIHHKEDQADSTPKNEQLKALEGVLEDLADWERILVLMRSDGRSYAEISAFVDKPEKQLKVYYQRIKERISKQINGK